MQWNSKVKYSFCLGTALVLKIEILDLRKYNEKKIKPTETKSICTYNLVSLKTTLKCVSLLKYSIPFVNYSMRLKVLANSHIKQSSVLSTQGRCSGRLSFCLGRSHKQQEHNWLHSFNQFISVSNQLLVCRRFWLE